MSPWSAPPEEPAEGWMRPRWLLLLVGIWLLIAILDFSRLAVIPPYREIWQGIALWRFPTWMMWCGFTVLIIAAGSRFPFEKPRRLRAAAVHGGLTIIILVLHTLISALLLIEFMPTDSMDAPEMSLGQAAGFVLLLEGPVAVVLCAGILGIFHGIRYYRGLQRQRVASSRLEAQLAQARLDNLQMQLHPHFLFNALNAVATLVRRGAGPEAVKVLAGLSDLLRQALDKSSQSWVKLEEEMELVAKYLALEEVRFKDRMQVEQQIGEQAAQAMVPTLILQPLVENAVRHGIAGRRSCGRIEIRARKEANGSSNKLVLEVLDNGPGPSQFSPANTGVGLTNTRARLAELFGTRANLDLKPRPGGGARARIRMPFCQEAPE